MCSHGGLRVFLGHGGECLFLGAPALKRGAEDREITYRFASSSNRTSLTVGPIVGIAKKGWEYMWGPLRRQRGHRGQGHREENRCRLRREGLRRGRLLRPGYPSVSDGRRAQENPVRPAADYSGEYAQSLHRRGPRFPAAQAEPAERRHAQRTSTASFWCAARAGPTATDSTYWALAPPC